MATESTQEEFLLAVKGKYVRRIARADHQSCWFERGRHDAGAFWEEKGYKIVKVYQPDYYDWQHRMEMNCTILDVEIGYHVQRLTALERLAVRLYTFRYWDIPY